MAFVDEVNNKIEGIYSVHPFQGGKLRFKIISKGDRKGILSTKSGKSEAIMLIMKLSGKEELSHDNYDMYGNIVYFSEINGVPVKFVYHKESSSLNIITKM